jgi:sulfate adenylyltransferase (ADP) / ATP adenylyltransferase
MTDVTEKTSEKILLKPNSLWQKTMEVTTLARQTGALKSIETEYNFIEQDGIAFLVRSLTNVIRKEQAKKEQEKQEKKTGQYIDPFLPYEKDLFVSNITPTHLCLLNKFNVVDHHLLIVTRDFEEQNNLLNLQDFIALWACLQEIDGLAFYNGGELAGASQKHKHLQIVPLPFFPNLEVLPITPAINRVKFSNALGKIPIFPFKNAIAKLDVTTFDNPLMAATAMLDCYYCLLEKVGFILKPNQLEQPGAYNFLATRKWMLIIPRSQESFQGISVNSLGFAGSLFVKNKAAFDLLKDFSPIKLLSEVAVVK